MHRWRLGCLPASAFPKTEVQNPSFVRWTWFAHAETGHVSRLLWSQGSLSCSSPCLLSDGITASSQTPGSGAGPFTSTARTGEKALSLRTELWLQKWALRALSWDWRRGTFEAWAHLQDRLRTVRDANDRIWLTPFPRQDRTKSPPGGVDLSLFLLKGH